MTEKNSVPANCDRSEVMNSVSNASRIVVYPLVRCASEHWDIGLNKGVLTSNKCLPVCGFAYTLDLVLTFDCSSHDGLKHHVTVHENIL